MKVAIFIFNINDKLGKLYHASTLIQRKKCRCGFEWDSFVSVNKLKDDIEAPYMLISTDVIEAEEWLKLKRFFI